MALSLRILENPAFVTLLRELTWEEADTNFIDLYNLIIAAGSPDFPSVVPYDPDFTYKPGVAPLFVTYDGNLYENIALEEHQGFTPDTNPSKWELSSVGKLAHAQNTDFKIVDKPTVITPTTSIYLSNYSAVNFLRIRRTTGTATYTVAIEAVLPPVSEGDPIPVAPTHPFFVYIDKEDLNTYSFTGGDLIKTRTLTAGQWMVIKAFNDGGVESESDIDILYPSTPGEGNPFDQELNTTNTVTFNGLLITGKGELLNKLIAFFNPTGELDSSTSFKLDENNNLVIPAEVIFSNFAEADIGKFLAIAAGGVTEKRAPVNINDVVLSQITLIDQVSGLPVTYQSVNNVLVAL